MIPMEVGRLLVRMARRSIATYLTEQRLDVEQMVDGPLTVKRGVFVSLYLHPSNGLRGCIGYPYPMMSLHEATSKAAVAAAFQDPRFPPLSVEELYSTVVEVSVLTEPEEIKVERRDELPRRVMVGRDGLILQFPGGGSLLLPQVAVENGWDGEEFLVNLCLKGGKRPTYWLEKEATILRFGAQIFREASPGGEVIEVSLGASSC